MSLTNRPGGLLVTRGLGGPTTQMITRGFLPFLVDQVVDAARGARVFGRRAKDKYQDLLEELKISVALVAINGKELFNPIINNVRHLIKDESEIKIKASPRKLTIQSPEISINVKIVEK